MCVCCKIATDQHKLINCCVCRNNYKHTCVGLTLNEVKTISTKPGLSYTCTNCSTIGKDINELKAVIAELKNEVTQLKLQKSDLSNDVLNNNTFNEIAQEVLERQRRSKNIIIYGINEISTMDRNTRLAQDTNNVKDVLNFLSLDTGTVNNISPMRLGKYLPDREKPRPIKIAFNDEQTVQNVIRRARQLKDSQYGRVHISLDRTPRQIEHYKSLKNELNERSANGENNLTIKYINGLPTIKSLN